MTSRVIVLAFLLLPYTGVSQNNHDTPAVEFLTGGLHFAPLIANTYEPRVGFIFQANRSDLRLDIGNSIDVIELHALVPEDARLTLGADFFTWTALRQDDNFHFPVDAVDYLFGLNISYSTPAGGNDTILARLRWSHISAHMVDGRYDKETGTWRDGQLPRVYSREFFELITAYEYASFLRPYAGITYVYHIDPSNLGKLALQAGIEATLPHSSGRSYHPYFAYDIRVMEIDAVTASHSIQAGIKAGNWHGKGLNIFIAYYSGMNVHGEYYDMRTEYWGPGITIDF